MLNKNSLSLNKWTYSTEVVETNTRVVMGVDTEVVEMVPVNGIPRCHNYYYPRNNPVMVAPFPQGRDWKIHKALALVCPTTLSYLRNLVDGQPATWSSRVVGTWRWQLRGRFGGGFVWCCGTQLHLPSHSRVQRGCPGWYQELGPMVRICCHRRMKMNDVFFCCCCSSSSSSSATLLSSVCSSLLRSATILCTSPSRPLDHAMLSLPANNQAKIHVKQPQINQIGQIVNL